MGSLSAFTASCLCSAESSTWGGFESGPSAELHKRSGVIPSLEIAEGWSLQGQLQVGIKQPPES